MNSNDCRAKTNIKNAIKPNRGLRPARGLARMENRKLVFKWSELNAVNLFKSCTTDAAAQVQTLGGCARAAALLILLLLPLRSMAVTGTVTHIDLPAATASELAEAPIPIGRLVQSSSDPKVVYIGDGYTFGGISLWNYAALTNPPPDYDRDLRMHNFHVRLDGSYSLNAEAGRLTAWYGTNAVWQIIAAASAADDVLLSVAPDGTNMAFTVASESDDVTVETCSSLVDPVWTAVAFGFERLTPLTVKITVPAPAAGEMQYIRVLAYATDVGMVVSIPLSVPSLTVGGAGVTAGAISNWNAAHAWGNHADGGYLTDETDPSWTAASGGVVYATTAGYTAAVDQAATAYGWGNHADGGYLTDASGWSSFAATQDVDAGGMSITNVVRIKDSRGNGAVGASALLDAINCTANAVCGFSALAEASDCLNNGALGGFAIYHALGTKWSAAAGYYALADSTVSNSAALGSYAGVNALGNAQLFADCYPDDPGETHSPTNDAIWGDNGSLSLGRTGPAAVGKTNELRGTWLVGDLKMKAGSTNVFLRPDGGTNTIVFDTNSNMQIYAGTNLALTVRADGNFGVRGGGASYPLHVSGNGYCTENIYAKKLIDSQNGAYSVDPNGASVLASLSLSSDLTVTQGVAKIILPTSTNGLVPGTLWNNGGTVSVMP